MMVNTRRNSLIVQAPPDKMAVIAQAVELLDVADPGSGSLQGFLGRMQVYRLSTLDPQKLVQSLQSLGGLDPTTRLEVDQENHAIIAYASVADHHTIRMTIEKLDGSARRVEVIPLRFLAADEVAGTIEYLMAGSGERRSSSRSDYWDPWSSSRRRGNDNNTDTFRVEADVVNNRLLVRANDVELEEVVSILVKLGEVPRDATTDGMTRVLEIAPGDETQKFLLRLQREFKALAPNELILPEWPSAQDQPLLDESVEAGSPEHGAATAAGPADNATSDQGSDAARARAQGNRRTKNNRAGLLRRSLPSKSRRCRPSR